jgi:hypothetical protein
MEKYICLRKIEWIPEIKVGEVVDVHIPHRSTGSVMVVVDKEAFIINGENLDIHFELASSRRQTRIEDTIRLL